MNSTMPPRHILMALAVVTIWGFTFVAMKVGLSEMPPLLMTALRFAATAALVVPFTRMNRQALPWVLLLSFTLGTMHFTLLFVGMKDIDGGTGAILIQLGVPFSTLLASVFLKDRLGVWRISGIFFAFAGAAVLAGGISTPTLRPVAILVTCAFSWAVSNLLGKKVSSIAPVAVAGWMALFATPQAAVASYLLEKGQWAAVSHVHWLGWAALAYLVVASSILAYTMWYTLLATHPISSVVPFGLLSPLIGVVASTVLLGDTLTWQKGIGGLMTLGGVTVIVLRQSMKTHAKQALGAGPHT